MKKKLIPSLLVFLALWLASTASPARGADAVPDPSGLNTGLSTDAQSPLGAFVVSPPPELSQQDKLDTNKLAAYQAAQKAFDDYTAQAKTEPLAVKLADSVGHNRVAINFVWILVAGFLVMFMQAGFRPGGNRPLPRQKRRPHHGHEFHDLPAWACSASSSAASPSCSGAFRPRQSRLQAPGHIGRLRGPEP